MFLKDISGGLQVVRAAALCYTERGERNALRVSGLDVLRFRRDFENTGSAVRALMTGRRRAAALVFFSAAGIAVRAIAPFVKSKLTDPAVIVVNDGGDYVIPLLSGHIGGANDIARELADELGAEAVITTATDNMDGVEAVDVWARREGFGVENMRDAKLVTAAMAAGRKTERVADRCGNIVWKVSNDEKIYAVLRPKSYVIGAGCRKGTDSGKMMAFVDEELAERGIGPEDVYKICSIDLKAGENCIIDTAMKMNVPFIVYSAGQLNEARGDFKASEFVKKVTGTDNVCERAAIAGCGKKGGRLLLKKTARDGMTLAIAERKL